MAYRNPRTHLATHEVINQPRPLEDVNLYTSDAILRASCAWSGATAHEARLEAFGAVVGSAATVEQGVRAFVDRHRPDELIVTAQIFDHAARLRSYDILRAIAWERAA